ncbi:MAG: hypothetical protein PHN92_14935 [Geobacter sp.]|nr:hypothetical protein [Geobacter sp.]
MKTEDSVSSQIKSYLSKLGPLTLVTLQDIYTALQVTTEQQASVRAAIYGLCAGTPVSLRKMPTAYYGIRLKLKNEKQIILSLPGIPREDLVNDTKLDSKTTRIIKRLQDKYGVEVINYWGKSAQRRSVDQANKGMKEAKIRDRNTCVICQHEGDNLSEPVSACHIISRKTLFWQILDEVEKTTGELFSERATGQLIEKLRDSGLHSNSRYIVTLCSEHNKILLNALKVAFTDMENNEKSVQERLLFQE